VKSVDEVNPLISSTLLRLELVQEADAEKEELKPEHRGDIVKDVNASSAGNLI
jgi:hypothetical protein